MERCKPKKERYDHLCFFAFFLLSFYKHTSK